MEKLINDVAVEFGQQLEKYLNHYGLAEADVAKMIGSNTESIKQIIRGEKNIVLKTAEQISKVFGLRYFKFGDPEFDFLDAESLPEETRLIISKRRKIGKPVVDRNNELKLPYHIIAALKSENLPLEFTSSDLFNLLPVNIQQSIKQPSRITDAFIKNNDLKKLVVDTNRKRRADGKRGRGLILYKLKKRDN